MQRFRRLDATTWLLNEQELQIDRIAAVGSQAYWRCFVYVEAKGVPSSGAYDGAEVSPKWILESRGYCSEEACIFRGRYLKRAFFDSGRLGVGEEGVSLGLEHA